jgi:ribosomal protein L37E
MNKYIKLKKRYPAEKYTTIADIKFFIRKAPEEAHKTLYWKDGKVNLINALRAHRLVDRGDYFHRSINNKRLEKGKDRRRKALKDIMLDKWCLRPNILKGARFKNGKIACNKCGSTELKYTMYGDGCGFVEYEYECQGCGSTIYHLKRSGTEYRFL